MSPFVYTVLALCVSSILMYGFVYLQFRQALQGLVMPHLEATRQVEAKAYMTLLNVVYFIFVGYGAVRIAEKLSRLQITTGTKGIEVWADMTGNQLFWLGALAILYVIALFSIKSSCQENAKNQGIESPEPW